MVATRSSSDAKGKTRRRFFYLFVAQVLALALFPYLDKAGGLMGTFRLLGTLVLFAGVYAVSEKRVQWVTALALAVPAVTLNSTYALRPDLPILVPALICTLAFLAYTLVRLLNAVIRARTVTADTIYGALGVYLLMGLTWAVAYRLIDILHPGALVIDPTRHPNHTIDWFDCVFYSFVTLTSLGYGDIVPMTAQARSLSILEAVSGTMYVAVLIARLVGVYSATRTGTEVSEED